MRKPITQISFNPKVAQRLTREQFISKYSSQYPDVDLHKHAAELGLISELVAEEAPAAFTPLPEVDEGRSISEPLSSKPKGRRRK